MSRFYIFLCLFFTQQAPSLCGSCKHKGVEVLQMDDDIDWTPMVLPFFSFDFRRRRAGCACQLTTPNPRELCPKNATMNVTNGKHSWWKDLGMRRYRTRRHAHHSGKRTFKKNIALKADCHVKVPLQPCPEKLRRSRRSPHKGGRVRGRGDSSREDKSYQRGRYYYGVKKMKQESDQRMCTDPVTKKTKVLYMQGSSTLTSTVMVTSTVYMPGKREENYGEEDEEEYDDYQDEEQGSFSINTAPIEGTEASFSISPTATRLPFEPTRFVPSQEIGPPPIMTYREESTPQASSLFTSYSVQSTESFLSSSEVVSASVWDRQSTTRTGGGSMFSNSISSLPSNTGESRLDVLISRDSITASSTQVVISGTIAVTSAQRKEDQVGPSISWKTEVPQEFPDETTLQSPRRRSTTTEAPTTAEQEIFVPKESSSRSLYSTSNSSSTVTKTEVPSTKFQISSTISTTKLTDKTTTALTSPVTTTMIPDTSTIQYTRRRITSTEKSEDTNRPTETPSTASQQTRQRQRETATEPSIILVTDRQAPPLEIAPKMTSLTTKSPEITTAQSSRWKVPTAAVENKDTSVPFAVSIDSSSMPPDTYSSTTQQSTRTTEGQTFTSNRRQESTSTWTSSSTKSTEVSATSSTRTSPLQTTFIETKRTQQVTPITRPPGLGLMDLMKEKGANDASNEIEAKNQITTTESASTTIIDRVTSPKITMRSTEKDSFADITTESEVRWRDRITTSGATISNRNDFDDRKKEGGSPIKSELSTSRVETSTSTMSKTQDAASTAPSLLLDIVNSGRGEKNNDKTSQSPTMSDLLESSRLRSSAKEITLSTSTAADIIASTQRDSKSNEAESSTINSLLSESKNRTDYDAGKRQDDHDESDMRKYVMFLLMGTSKCNACPDKSPEKKTQASETESKALQTKDSDGGYFYIGYRSKNSTLGVNELSIHEKKSDCSSCSKNGIVPVKITQLEFDCNSMFKSFFA